MNKEVIRSLQACLFKDVIKRTGPYLIRHTVDRNRDVTGFGSVFVNPMATLLPDRKPTILLYDFN